MFEQLSEQEERDQQRIDALLNKGCTTIDNLRVAIKEVRILDHCTHKVLESFHVGSDCGMYAVNHALGKTYGRCLTDFWYMNG